MTSPIDFAALVAAAGDAVVVSDPSGAITVWNPAATRIFGYTAAEAIGQSLDLITPERQRRRHWEGYAKTMQTGVTKYGADVPAGAGQPQGRPHALHRFHGRADPRPRTTPSPELPRSSATKPSAGTTSARPAPPSGGPRIPRRLRATRDTPRRPSRSNGTSANPEPGPTGQASNFDHRLSQQGERHDEQATRGYQDHRLHPRPGRPGLHAAPGLVRRRRDQGRAPWVRRRDPDPASPRRGRGRALLHDAQLQQALPDARHQDPRGQGGPGESDRSPTSWSRISAPAPSTGWASPGRGSTNSTRA